MEMDTCPVWSTETGLPYPFSYNPAKTGTNDLWVLILLGLIITWRVIDTVVKSEEERQILTQVKLLLTYKFTLPLILIVLTRMVFGGVFK